MTPAQPAQRPSASRTAERVSAWMDGDTSPDGHPDVAAWDDEAWRASWHSYHVIGDVLRGRTPGEAEDTPLACSQAEAWAFARRVVEQAGAAQAAEGASAGGALVQVPVLVAAPTAQVAATTPQPAANDAVFRWKMVAGFASVAAVAVVAWSVVGGLGGSPDRGAVLASGGAAAPAVQVAGTNFPVAAVTSVAQTLPEPVWVATPQGVMLRDPRLEELMRTHRQTGGGAVLQVPAGFLRAATHDAGQR